MDARAKKWCRERRKAATWLQVTGVGTGGDLSFTRCLEEMFLSMRRGNTGDERRKTKVAKCSVENLAKHRGIIRSWVSTRGKHSCFGYWDAGLYGHTHRSLTTRDQAFN